MVSPSINSPLASRLNTVVTADGFSRIWPAHDRGLAAQSLSSRLELSSDHTGALKESIIEFDFIGKPVALLPHHQMAAIREMGCQMAQGFLLGRPSPAEVLDTFEWPDAATPAAVVPSL